MILAFVLSYKLRRYWCRETPNGLSAPVFHSVPSICLIVIHVYLWVIDYGGSSVQGSAAREKLQSGSRNPLFFWAGRDIYCRYGWLPLRKEATDWMWKMWTEREVYQGRARSRRCSRTTGVSGGLATNHTSPFHDR